MIKHALFGLDYAFINNKFIPIDLKTPVSGLCAFFKAKFPSTKSRPSLFLQKKHLFGVIKHMSLSVAKNDNDDVNSNNNNNHYYCNNQL